MDRRLTNMARAYRKADPPPHKVKPIPIQLVLHCVLALQGTALGRCMANLLVMGYFYLLRPGEYTYDKANNHPFRLCDATFNTHRGLLNAAVAAPRQLQSASQVLLNFTTQKNMEKDQAIAHGDTNDPLLSPVKAVRRQVLHLRQHKAPPTTPLHTVYLPDGTTTCVTARMLTNALRASCKAIGPTLGIQSRDISVRALRAGGCMALMRAGVDSSIARLLGRWKSWAMIEYLRQSSLDTTSYAGLMLKHGRFTIPTHQHLPADVLHRFKAHLSE